MIGLLRPLTCLATLLLAACEQSGRQADVPVGGGDQWAVDACKTFPAAAAAKASGLAIETTTLGAQVSVAGTTVSSCGYATAGNRESFGVLLRQDTTGKATIDQQVAAITSAPAETGPSEIVEMQKGKAVWQPQLRSLAQCCRGSPSNRIPSAAVTQFAPTFLERFQHNRECRYNPR